MSDNPQKPNAPVYTHRNGAIFSKIWVNESAEGKLYYNVTIGRTYTDPKTNEPRDTGNLRKHELPIAQFLMGEAYRTISQMQEMDVKREHLSPPVEQVHLGLQTQREAAMSNVPPSTPSNGQETVAPVNAHMPEQ